MKTRNWRTAVAVAGAAAVTALVAACGSSGGGAASPAANAPTGPPIVLGMLVAKTGLNSAQAGPTTDVVEAWSTWVNGRGGIDGRPVEVVIEDSAANPVTAQARAKELVEDRKVAAVILQDAASEGAVGGYLQDKGVQVIGAAGFDPSVWGVRPNYTTIITTPPAIHQSHVAAAAALGANPMLSVVCAEVPSCAQAATNVEREAAKLNETVVGSAKISASEPNYTALCLSAIEKNVQYLAGALTPDVASRVGADCLQQGYQGYLGVTGLLQERADEVPGVKYAGGIFAFPWWSTAPAVAEYRQVMEDIKPDADLRNPSMSATWASLQLFGKTMDRVKPADVTAATVAAAYGTISGETLDGLLPQPMTLTAGQPAPQVRCFWLFRYTSGEGDPQTVNFGPSGNGVQGDLASSCAQPAA